MAHVLCLPPIELTKCTERAKCTLLLCYSKIDLKICIFMKLYVYGLMMNWFNQNKNRNAIDFIVHHRVEFDYNMHEVTMSRGSRRVLLMRFVVWS